MTCYNKKIVINVSPIHGDIILRSLKHQDSKYLCGRLIIRFNRHKEAHEACTLLKSLS